MTCVIRSLMFLLWLMSGYALAQEIFSFPLSEQTGWIFSGVVNSESGDIYGYYFELKREGIDYHIKAALIDAVSRTVIFQENEAASLKEVTPYDWHVGNAFLKFNPINDTWLMGVRRVDNQGFNFKVDMLTQLGTKVNSKVLKQGLMMTVLQTGELNGHLQRLPELGAKFVTAKHVWFRQIWQTEPYTSLSSLKGLLCQFHDGSSLYSILLHDQYALSGAMAAWFDPAGMRMATSQFVQIASNDAKDEKAFSVKLSSPKVNLKIKDLVQQEALLAGFVEGQQHQGFCVVTNDKLG